MSISVKRHHNLRIKAKFKRLQKHRKVWGDGPKSEGMFANHGKTCSCWMCGNPRKYFGHLTQQEHIANLALHESLLDLEDSNYEYTSSLVKEIASKCNIVDTRVKVVYNSAHGEYCVYIDNKFVAYDLAFKEEEIYVWLADILSK